jgi:hypothetical protein
MSETITEMILPGTYIDVRAEGLIGVSGIASGNVGVVGTANRGPLGRAVLLGSYADAVETFGSYDRWPDQASDQPRALTLTRTLEQLFKGGATTVYAVRVANITGIMPSTTWSVARVVAGPADDELFKIVARTPGTWANDIVITLAAPTGQPVTVSIVYGRQKEQFEAETAEDLADAIADGSALVTTTDLDTDAADERPTRISAPVTVSSNGDAATTTEVAAGLALLAPRPVNIVVVGGMDAKTAAGTVLAHLEATENDGRERLAVLGASSNTPDTVISDDVSAGSNPRLVLVAPGIQTDDAARVGEASKRVSLPPSYGAALVAGKLATLAPHVSMTNKDVPADDVAVEYTRAQQKQLLTNQVLVLHKSLGIRVLKGITTDTGAFRQISVRRIVDYAKEGVRRGSNPYIGRLNNSRVRGALKATLDGFLSGMVLDEMLVAYKLEVSATRAQEIVGQAIVTMTLQPTFSIDFVKVIMNLE